MGAWRKLDRPFWMGALGVWLSVIVGITGCSDNDSNDNTYVDPEPGHPAPQPRPALSIQVTSDDGSRTRVQTTEGLFEEQDPFLKPPGNNHLETVYENARDGLGVEMAHTLPSTPTNPYNLHPDPVVSEINAASQRDDLKMLFDRMQTSLADSDLLEVADIDQLIDILEGNPVQDRVYSGFPILHYQGPKKQKTVSPIFDKNGEVIGGNVNVRQIWADNHIESDTAFIDPSAVWDVPWTITYTVDVLNRGTDDFSPFVMYFDSPELSAEGKPRKPHIGLDQTFFPMEDGTRVVFKIGMAPARYWNLTYTWGWRKHPPRVQVIENALKRFSGKALPEWEISVFGNDPTESEQAKLDAIGKLGDIAPAKVMWNRMHDLKDMVAGTNGTLTETQQSSASNILVAARRAFVQWKDRTKLPDGVYHEKGCDLTLLYANNTIYGEFADGSTGIYYPWSKRGADISVCLVNGDYYDHAYTNIDFGGARGWENTFQSTTEIGGAGPWFTFGRVHWWPIAGTPSLGEINVPAAQTIEGTDVYGKHTVDIEFNFEPSRRLRFYQFDPKHHDTAVYSVH
ncbi:Uncharacterised protein [BD1-7 clade bacterium]|uniref:Uncharacterized protein n=1 Tax=BD1-7 clade bacterium TaxID=2029982 RepID=A0A5S9QKU2_9GAMM|nr:Uncharacterised protein [BD1-7 clade bacterium]CAA0115834.1 Uncharacterised protein [BD1-7 clade bacterium]CAA0119512.1 Uncharacterised protein [BD1-7 clade bacterium]